MPLLYQAAQIRNRQQQKQQHHHQPPPPPPPATTASTNSALPSTIHLRGNALSSKHRNNHYQHQQREVWLDVYNYAQASLTPGHPSKRNYASTSASVLLDAFIPLEEDEDTDEAERGDHRQTQHHPKHAQENLHQPSVDNVVVRKQRSTQYFSKKEKGVVKNVTTTDTTVKRKQRPQSAASTRRKNNTSARRNSTVASTTGAAAAGANNAKAGTNAKAKAATAFSITNPTPTTTTRTTNAPHRSGSRTARGSFTKHKTATKNNTTNTATTTTTTTTTTSTANGERKGYLTSRGDTSEGKDKYHPNNRRNENSHRNSNHPHNKTTRTTTTTRRQSNQRPSSARPSSKRKKESANQKDVVSVVELSFANGNHYQGEWCNAKPFGFGTYKWKDGSEYCGQFVKGEFHGRGSKQWTTGKKYSGDWEHSLYSGHGELTYVDSSQYVGSFKDGMFHGRGRREWLNNDVYDGEWVTGKREGIGLLTRGDQNTQFVYQGNWFNGKMHGHGRAEWNGGTSVNNGKKKSGGHGEKGNSDASEASEASETSEATASTASTASNASNDANNTSSTIAATKTCYEGQWNNGLRHGHGTLTTLSGKDKSIVGVVVKGTFVRGRIHGKATLIYPEGDKYIGLVERGQPNGEGIMYWTDSSSFEGEFVAGTPCGKGIYRDSNGELSGCFGIAGVSGPGSKMWKIHKSEVTMDICGKNNSGKTGSSSTNTNKNTNTNTQDDEGKENEKPEDWVEMKYVGQLMDDKMHGPGTLCWPDGRVYSGHFVQDQIEGQGTMRWKDAFAEQHNTQPDGVRHENTYIGSFHNGRFEGQGKLIFADGAIYKGCFKDGLFHGKGDFMGCLPPQKEQKEETIEVSNVLDTSNNEEKRMRITGKWRHGKPDGVVEIDFDQVHGGGTYRGEVTRGMFSGKGTRVWLNGNIFIGQWETCGSSGGGGGGGGGSGGGGGDGVHKGLLMHADDRGTMHGRGSYLYSNGCQYVGEFEHGVRSGSGKQIWTSGHLYVGDWKHDAPHGFGMFVDGTSSVSLSGQWNHGRLIKEIIEQVVPFKKIGTDNVGTDNVATSTVPKTQTIMVGVMPFENNQIHIGVAGEEDDPSDLLLIRQKKNPRRSENMRINQIQIRLDGSLYIGTTWRGVNHGNGLHVSFDGTQREGPWTMGCSSDSKFIKHKDQRTVEHANAALCMMKDDLRSKVKKMMVPRK